MLHDRNSPNSEEVWILNGNKAKKRIERNRVVKDDSEKSHESIVMEFERKADALSCGGIRSGGGGMQRTGSGDNHSSSKKLLISFSRLGHRTSTIGLVITLEFIKRQVKVV